MDGLLCGFRNNLGVRDSDVLNQVTNTLIARFLTNLG